MQRCSLFVCIIYICESQLDSSWWLGTWVLFLLFRVNYCITIDRQFLNIQPVKWRQDGFYVGSFWFWKLFSGGGKRIGLSLLNEFQTTSLDQKITPKFRAVFLICADRHTVPVDQGFMPIFTSTCPHIIYSNLRLDHILLGFVFKLFLLHLLLFNWNWK